MATCFNKKEKVFSLLKMTIVSVWGGERADPMPRLYLTPGYVHDIYRYIPILIILLTQSDNYQQIYKDIIFRKHEDKLFYFQSMFNL